MSTNYRIDGPSTSREAAESLSADFLSDYCYEIYLVLQSAGADGATTDEVCVALGMLENKASVSRRLTDLGESNMAEVIGKRPGRSGRKQQVWRAI